MKMEKRWLWSELGSLECPDTSALKGKQSKKRRKSKRHAKENRTTGENTGHHGRGAHHGQTVAATTGCGVHHGLAVVAAVVVARLFSPCAAFWSFGVSPWAAGFAFSWVFWASLQASFGPHGPHFISLDSSQTFLPKSWLESQKSAINVQQTKTEHNRRKYA